MIATSWLTSGWIDVASVVGWMVLVIAVGVVVWRRSGRPEEPAGPAVEALSGLAGRAIALLALGRTLGRRSRK